MRRISYLLGAIFIYFSSVVVATSTVLHEHAIKGEIRNSEFSYTVNLDTEEKELEYLFDNTAIKYSRYVAFLIVPENSGSYSISALCEEEAPIGLSVIDEKNNIVGLSEQDSNRSHRRVIKAQLKSNHKYYLLLGSGSKDKELTINLTLSASGKLAGRGDIKPKPLAIGQTMKSAIDQNSYVFEGQKVDFYSLNNLKKQKWTHISLTSDEFDTYGFILNSNSEIISKNDDSTKFDKSSLLKISPDTDARYLVVARYQKISQKEAEQKTFPYEVVAVEYSYDPDEGMLELVSFYMSNPALTFILGIAVSLIIGFFFYKKGLTRRFITYEELVDHTIIAERDREGGLEIVSGTDKTSCASLYKFSFSVGGHSRITKDLIKKNISLKLNNIKKIIDIKISKKGSWGEFKLTNGDTISIGFDHLDPGDYCVISAICDQDINSKSLAITPDVEGEILETSIKDMNHVGRRFMRAFLSTSSVLAVLIVPLVLVDVNYRFMPSWWPELITSIWPFWMSIILGYFILTRTGRNEFIAYARASAYHVKSLFLRQ